MRLQLRNIIDSALLAIPTDDPVAFKILVRSVCASRSFLVSINQFSVDLADIRGNSSDAARNLCTRYGGLPNLICRLGIRLCRRYAQHSYDDKSGDFHGGGSSWELIAYMKRIVGDGQNRGKPASQGRENTI
jgi:hypothetical protein